jgi:hypothetical protein
MWVMLSTIQSSTSNLLIRRIRICRIIILHVVLHGYETLTLFVSNIKEQSAMKKFVPQKDEVVGGWKSFITCTLT